jgi:hypothetical protein
VGRVEYFAAPRGAAAHSLGTTALKDYWKGSRCQACSTAATLKLIKMAFSVFVYRGACSKVKKGRYTKKFKRWKSSWFEAGLLTTDPTRLITGFGTKFIALCERWFRAACPRQWPNGQGQSNSHQRLRSKNCLVLMQVCCSCSQSALSWQNFRGIPQLVEADAGLVP